MMKKWMLCGEMVMNRSLESDSWTSKCLSAEIRITTLQLVWIIKHTLISSCICFGACFGLCTLVFAGNPNPSLWRFPTPIAGTYAVTLCVEIVLNWFISGSLMTFEIIHGKVAPLHSSFGQCIPDLVWYSKITELVLSSDLTWSRRFFNSGIRCIPWIGIIGLTLLPVFTLCTWLLYGNDHYSSFPQPEFLVSVFGALVALFTIPFWAIFTLIDVGRERETHTLLV